MLLTQEQAPLLEQLQVLSQQLDSAFYAPGHKKGRGIAKNLEQLLGKAVFQADLPELPELDNLFAPEGVIQQAQELAAAAFGAEQTWFLINGSTCGIIAAILATCNTNEKIILPRNIHRSAVAGLIVSGAIPIFLNPEYDATRDLTLNITPEAIEKALKQHPDTKAIMLLHPTYQGIAGDISAIIELAHNQGIPVLVDEAHGAHFAFHEDLPPTALSVGADLCVQSTHKVLGAMTQASMLHIQGEKIDRQRLTQTLALVQSTSPSYLLLASLDAARRQMALEGKNLMSQTIALAEIAKTQISKIPGLSILEVPRIKKKGFDYLDPTRLTVRVSQLGISGFEADTFLREQFNVTAELPTLQNLTFIFSLGNNTEDVNKLIQGFTHLAKNIPDSINTFPITDLPLLPQLSLSPRGAFFAAKETLPWQKTINRISAELICPYPPGIPTIMPGEIITTEAIDYLKQILNLGGTITGCSDSKLDSFQVVC